jgi:hypothetical protein
MPKTFIQKHLAEKKRAEVGDEYDARTGEVTVVEPASVADGIPPLPELESPLGPEGRASFQCDWRNIVRMVEHGLVLREVLNAIVEGHREEGQVEVELSAKPRDRAAQIIEIMAPWQARYTPILTAIREWMAALSGLRRFQNGVATPNIGGAVDNALRALNRPLRVLSTLPEAPETVDPNDLQALRDATDIATNVRDVVQDVWNAPDEFRHALRSVIEVYDRLRDEIDRNDREGVIDGVTMNSWGTVPPSYPLPVVDLIPQGVAGDGVRRYHTDTTTWP